MVLLAKVVGDPLQEIAVVYWPLLASDTTGVAPVTGAVIVTFGSVTIIAVSGNVKVKTPALAELADVAALPLTVKKLAVTPVNV